MSMCSSRFELHAIDSPVLGPVDSVSVPSEPPDLRNWFPSYICDESPELNTLDGLQDFNGLGETCNQEGKKGKSRESHPACESNDDLLSAKRKSPDKVTWSSESLSFSSVIPSEPPDIKNWFSSYLYESPPLDTTYEFTVSDYKVREEDKVSNAEKSCRPDNKDAMDFFDVEDSIELHTQSRTLNMGVKFTNLAKDSKLNYQPVDKDDHSVALRPIPSIMRRLTSKKVSKQLSPGQRTGNNHIGSVEKLGDKNTYSKYYDVKLDCSLLEKTIPKLSNNIGSHDGKYGHKSIGRKDCVKDSLEKEDLHEITSPGTLDLTEPEEDSRRRPADRRRIGKENKETELLENGFVSVSKENAGNLTRPVQVQFESLRQGVKPALSSQKTANISRKVLSETSNFLSPGKSESTGKWCCPRKNKPNRGPPLKQLRLEQWVRRV